MLKHTALHDTHQKLGAKLAPFAGFEMPLYYPDGAIKEHLLCREQAAIFDVSHMGQIEIKDHRRSAQTVLKELEKLIPSDLLSLQPGQQRYGLLLNKGGGIIDDLMVMNMDDHVRLVVNAACVDTDIAWLEKCFRRIRPFSIEQLDRSLVAVQGPNAETALCAIVPEASKLKFMQVGSFLFDGQDIQISRSGYTGEDGFEISLPNDKTAFLIERLRATGQADMAGLVARDSLRLEAGLCLYGQDMDETTTVMDAGLDWAIGRARRADGARPRGFCGADKTLQELQAGGSYQRIGAKSLSKQPVRPGTKVFCHEQVRRSIGNVTSGSPAPHVVSIGEVTSGSPAPSVGCPVVMMSVVASEQLSVGNVIWADVRGKRVRLDVCAMPFFPHRFKR